MFSHLSPFRVKMAANDGSVSVAERLAPRASYSINCQCDAVTSPLFEVFRSWWFIFNGLFSVSTVCALRDHWPRLSTPPLHVCLNPDMSKSAHFVVAVSLRQWYQHQICDLHQCATLCCCIGQVCREPSTVTVVTNATDALCLFFTCSTLTSKCCLQGVRYLCVSCLHLDISSSCCVVYVTLEQWPQGCDPGQSVGAKCIVYR